MSPRSPKAPLGRRTGPTQTRDALLDAARERFHAEGYAGASLRGIARDAGVDPALVGHFFGSKAGLYAAVVRWPLDPAASIAHMLDGDPDRVGWRVAETFVLHWETARWRSPLIALTVVAAEDPAVATLLRDFLVEELFIPMLTALGSAQARRRAGLLSSHLLGVGLGRHVIGLLGPDTMDDQELIATIGPVLQRYCTEPLLVAAPPPGP